MEIKYIFHSGFLLRENKLAILTDYWRDTEGDEFGAVHELLKEKDIQLYIFSSHHHSDHFNPIILDWAKENPNIHLILSWDIVRHYRHRNPEVANYVNLHSHKEYQDENIRVKTFGSTDAGVSFAIEAFGLKIFHAGDFNNWLWRQDMPAGEARGAEHDYLLKLEELSKEYPAFDWAMFPVDPRLDYDCLRGPRQFLEAIKVKNFVPMHYEFEPGKKYIIQQFQQEIEKEGYTKLIWG